MIQKYYTRGPEEQYMKIKGIENKILRKKNKRVHEEQIQ
jgi:hypothetical protein